LGLEPTYRDFRALLEEVLLEPLVALCHDGGRAAASLIAEFFTNAARALLLEVC
jgi:hypothetical protein